MPDKAQEIINGLGVMAETCAIMRDALIKNGFTRPEAITLCQTYLKTMLLMSKTGTEES